MSGSRKATQKAASQRPNNHKWELLGERGIQRLIAATSCGTGQYRLPSAWMCSERGRPQKLLPHHNPWPLYSCTGMTNTSSNQSRAAGMGCPFFAPHLTGAGFHNSECPRAKLEWCDRQHPGHGGHFDKPI